VIDSNELRPIRRTSVITPLFVVDEIFRNNKFSYVVISRETKQIGEVDQFPDDPYLYLPYEDYDGVQLNQFFLPQEPLDYGGEDRLDEALYDFLNYWCDYPKEFKILDVAYIKMTWLFDWLSVVPYRRALGDWGTGKSRWADCMLTVSRYGFKQGATTTAPGIYRTADIYRGVQGFDENNYTGKSAITKAIHNVLNCSYQKSTGAVIRMEKQGDDYVPRRLICYGPKIISARNTFEDIATESRCITHRSYKSHNVPLGIDKEFWQTAQDLRNKLLMWRINHTDKVPLERKKFEKTLIEHKIDPRLIEVSKPLTRFMSKETQLETLAKVVLHCNDLLATEKFFTHEATVLRSVSAIINEGKPPLIGYICDRINDVEGRMSWQKCTEKDVKKVLTSMQLVVRQKYVKEKKSNPNILIIEGRYVKDLIDRMYECNVKVPKMLQNQYEKQVREMNL